MITINMNNKFVVYEFKKIYPPHTYYRGKTSMKRWLKGYTGTSDIFDRAVNKYGINAFRKRLLGTFDCEDEAYDYEEFEVNTQKEDSLSYNICGGGRGTSSGKNHPHYGKSPSIITRDKIRKTKIGKPHTQEHKDKISQSKLGQNHTQKTLNKMSIIKMGVNNPNFKYTDEFLLSKYNPDISIYENSIKIFGRDNNSIYQRLIKLININNLPYKPNQKCVSKMQHNKTK